MPAALPARDYDVIVIGSGSGGSVTAPRLTEKGDRVAVRPLRPAGYAVDTVRTGAWRPGRTARTFTAEHVVFAAGTRGTQQLLHRMKATGTLMTDGGGQLPRGVKWLARATRHPGQLASLYAGINHWTN